MKTQILYILVLATITLMLTRCGEVKTAKGISDIVYETIDDDGKKGTDNKKDPSEAKDTRKVNRKPLTLVVTNLRLADAPVMVGLYNKKENFLQEDARLKEYKFIPIGNTLTAQITDRTYGEYAVAIYQDENSSGEIDKNALGVPKEGYCFSNNAKPKIKAPSYKDCKFDYDEKANTVTMKMIW